MLLPSWRANSIPRRYRKHESINTQETRANRTVLELPIGSLLPGSGQPRQHFEPEALDELAASIRRFGVLQPLLVTRLETTADEQRFRIVAGERRWRAAARAGRLTVPALLIGVDDLTGREVALIENLHRSDLRPLELAQALDAIVRQSGMTHDELARRLGKSRVSITNTVRLLGLGIQAQAALHAGTLSEGHARALLGIAGQVQVEALATVIDRGLSVRQTEMLVRRLAKGTRTAQAISQPPAAELDVVAGALRTVLGAKVMLTGTEQVGKIVIEYGSREELERLCERIGGDDLALALE